MSNRWFFSFGPGDSYISKSFVGLRHRNLPPELLDLITSGKIVETYWAALGPIKECWVITYKDLGGKTRLKHGADIPKALRKHVRNTNPTPNFTVSLGPPPSRSLDPSEGSFIAWDWDSIRWSNLPPRLEACIQSWLSPSGWTFGPPRIITWGQTDAFFALSEYGEAEWYSGTGDPPYETTLWSLCNETLEEWGDEDIPWSELAFIALDPTTTDQFVAIQNDGTWAGSIGDVNEEALETFALNFFARTRSKGPQTEPRGQPNGIPKPDIPDAKAQALYESWSTETATRLAAALAAIGGKGPRKLEIRNLKQTNGQGSSLGTAPAENAPKARLLTEFPYLPPALTTCARTECVAIKSDPESIRACKHDVERLFRASGLYSFEWLRQERLRWHPDRFGRLCEESFRERGKKLAEEMFKVIDLLMTDLQKSAGISHA